MSVLKNRVFNDAEDKNVAVVKVFANESKELFYDADLTKAVPAEDCLNLFYKGVVCVKGTTVYAAVSCTEDGVIDFGL